MALVKSIVGQISGSIAGTTYSHNKSGQYIRQRVIPVNPGSSFQNFYRSAFAQTAARWKTLATVVRDAWATYAANTPTTNRLGDTIYLDAMNWYIAVNVVRTPAGLGFLDAAPVTPGLSTLTAPTFTMSEATQIASVVFDNTDPWAIADDGLLVVQQGIPQTQSINYFKGPWQPMQFILGDTAIPPTSPDVSGTLRYAVVEDQKQFMRFRGLTADGRLTAPIIASTIVAA